MLRMRGEGSAPLLFRAADHPAVLDSPRVQRSRSFGFAETVSKRFAVRVARLRMAHRGGRDRSLTATCVAGYSNSGNVLDSSCLVFAIGLGVFLRGVGHG